MRLLALCLACAILAAAQSTFDEALSLARQKHYAEAREALRATPEPDELQRRIVFHRLRAAIASGLGEPATAADEMREALALAPQDSGLLLATAAAELAANQLDGAIAHARAAGHTATAQSLLGDLFEKRGDYVEAAKAYQAAVALAPEREEYRIALALELVQHQTFRPAITVLEQAAPLFPQSARIRTLLGIAQYALGDNEKAVASLVDAVQVDPGLQPAYAYLARIVLESSAAPPQRAMEPLCRWDDAVCAALKLRQARGQNDPKLYAEAMSTLERAPRDRALTRCELGRAYEWSERWAEAREQMETCVRLDPSPPNHYRLALIYRQLGLTDLARREMTLRDQALEQLSEEGARRLNATQAFQYAVK